MPKPHVMLGFNVCAAETDAEARYLRSSSLQAILRLRQGAPGKLPPPVADFESALGPAEHAMLAEFSVCSAVGSPATVADSLSAFIARTGADELMVVTQVYDHAARLRSYEILADVHRELYARAAA
jgi:alkanesulfonate monooxygenase SsuD/methylene tetrahydromethanopterin reductase-like flavin-dependent oxidoreductase (luciferase family)